MEKNEDSENSQDSLRFLSTSNTTSNALTALQEYGPVSWWNINNYNAGSSLAAASPLSHLNLNSIEDEDAFLYGDSNSLPEEQTCVENDNRCLRQKMKTGVSHKLESLGYVSSPVTEKNEFPEASSAAVRHELQNADGVDTAWSDEEDTFVKTSEITTTKEENVDLSLEISEKTRVSPKLASHDSLVIIKKEFPEVSSVVADQSPHPTPHELPKKHTNEENVINISSNKDSSNSSPGTSKHVFNPDRCSSTNLKMAFKRLNPKMINKKHIDNIRDYITRNERKRCRASVESPIKKHGKHEIPKKSSPPSDRFSLPGPKCKSSDHTKREFFYSNHKSPSFESGSHPSIKKHETSRSFSLSRTYSPRRSSSSRPKPKLSQRKESYCSHFKPKKRPSEYAERHGCYIPSPKKISPEHDYRCKKRSRKKKTDHNRCSSSPSSRHRSSSRSSLPNYKCKSSKRGRESPYSTRRSSSFGSKERSSRYTERYTRDSSSPKRGSRSSDYQCGRRSSERSIDYNRYKGRKRSRSRSRRSFRSTSRSRRSLRSRSRSRRSFRSTSRSRRSLRSTSRSRRSLRSTSRSRRSLSRSRRSFRSRSRSRKSLRSRSRNRRLLRSRSRSHRSLRSRLRSSWYKSPGYYPASTKTYDKKKICKLSKKSAYYSEKKEILPFSSDNSLLSFDSSSC